MAIIRRKNQMDFMDFIINSYENGALLDSDEVRKLDKEFEMREADEKERMLSLQRTINSKVNNIEDSHSYPKTILSKFYVDVPQDRMDEYYNEILREYYDKMEKDNFEKMEENRYKRSSQ